MDPVLTKYGQSSFRVELDGQHIYVDPFKIPDGQPTADIILLSHDHGDHYSPEDIAKIRGDNTQVIAAHPSVSSKIGEPFIPLQAGQTEVIDDIAIRAVPAYTITKRRPTGEATHPKESGYLGFIIDNKGQNIYFAGDTDVIPEMESFGQIDFAVLPVSGTFVMTAEEAVEAVRIIKPAVAVPCHYGHVVGSIEDAQKFAELVPENVRVIILEETT